MSAVDRILRGFERRQAPVDLYPRPSGQWTTMWGTSSLLPARSGTQALTVDTALELIPVYSAVELLAGAIGSLPLKVYRKGQTRTEADQSRQWKILHDRPNDEMAADEFWEIVSANLLLWGNAFLWKERDVDGIVQKLWPIRSSRVMVGRVTERGRSIRYFTLDGIEKKIYEADILHIRGLSPDGQVGYSPIQQARMRLVSDSARDEFQQSFWRNGMLNLWALKHPNTLSEPAQERLKRQVAAKAGARSGGVPLFLEEGLDIANIAMPLTDAQFVEQAGLGRLEVALLFRIPPHMLGAETPNSLTYSSAEWESLDFIKWSLRRWLVRIENSLLRDSSLFPAGGPNLYPEFLVDALLRGDGKSRWEQYEIMERIGVVDPAWIAETENLPMPPKKAEPAPVIVGNGATNQPLSLPLPAE